MWENFDRAENDWKNYKWRKRGVKMVGDYLDHSVDKIYLRFIKDEVFNS